MLSGFKEFILRGNVIDLAVAVVIGAAFTAIVNTIVSALINPLIGALFQADSLDDALVVSIPTLNGGSADLLFGAVLGAILQFLIVALVVYFAFVVPVNHLKKVAFQRDTAVAEQAPAAVKETDVLLEIRDLLAAQGGAAGTGGHRAEGSGGHRADV